MKSDKTSVTGARAMAFVAGASAGTISLACYIGFVFASSAHSWAWLRPGYWTSLAGMVLSSFGKSKSRGFGVASSVLMLVLWTLFAWAPA